MKSGYLFRKCTSVGVRHVIQKSLSRMLLEDRCLVWAKSYLRLRSSIAILMSIGSHVVESK